jgi:amino acid transporter
VPALLTGVLAILLLVINVGNQSVFLTLTSVAIIMFYIAYLGVTLPMLLKRFRGEWPRPEHGPYFSMGRFGLPVNLFAVVYGAVVAINIAWPRRDVYNAIGKHHWYLQWGAVLFIGIVALVGAVYYLTVYRHKPVEVLAEHRAMVPAGPGAPVGEVAP